MSNSMLYCMKCFKIQSDHLFIQFNCWSNSKINHRTCRGGGGLLDKQLCKRSKTETPTLKPYQSAVWFCFFFHASNRMTNCNVDITSRFVSLVIKQSDKLLDKQQIRFCGVQQCYKRSDCEKISLCRRHHTVHLLSQADLLFRSHLDKHTKISRAGVQPNALQK